MDFCAISIVLYVFFSDKIYGTIFLKNTKIFLIIFKLTLKVQTLEFEFHFLNLNYRI